MEKHPPSEHPEDFEADYLLGLTEARNQFTRQGYFIEPAHTGTRVLDPNEKIYIREHYEEILRGEEEPPEFLKDFFIGLGRQRRRDIKA